MFLELKLYKLVFVHCNETRLGFYFKCHSTLWCYQLLNPSFFKNTSFYLANPPLQTWDGWRSAPTWTQTDTVPGHLLGQGGPPPFRVREQPWQDGSRVNLLRRWWTIIIIVGLYGGRGGLIVMALGSEGEEDEKKEKKHYFGFACLEPAQLLPGSLKTFRQSFQAGQRWLLIPKVIIICNMKAHPVFCTAAEVCQQLLLWYCYWAATSLCRNLTHVNIILAFQLIDLLLAVDLWPRSTCCITCFLLFSSTRSTSPLMFQLLLFIILLSTSAVEVERSQLHVWHQIEKK